MGQHGVISMVGMVVDGGTEGAMVGLDDAGLSLGDTEGCVEEG